MIETIIIWINDKIECAYLHKCAVISVCKTAAFFLSIFGVMVSSTNVKKSKKKQQRIRWISNVNLRVYKGENREEMREEMKKEFWGKNWERVEWKITFTIAFTYQGGYPSHRYMYLKSISINTHPLYIYLFFTCNIFIYMTHAGNCV